MWFRLMKLSQKTGIDFFPKLNDKNEFLDNLGMLKYLDLKNYIHVITHSIRYAESHHGNLDDINSNYFL